MVENDSACDDSTDSLLPPSDGIADLPSRLGSRVGPYKLLRVLGEGGFGVVYLAEQEQPIRRRAALKIIKPGMDTKQVLARFEAERQALALMDHPNIARVLDAGATKAGRPYFVMELVHGEPITEYCDRQKLTIEQRLELFIPICHAVQHAHQKGVIHRDLKPTNILVAIHDEQPLPKIIDFGVAKATAQPLTERTLYTERGQLIGTPEYMSPEQAEMSAVDVDTRTDVYSLGVLLYELLTGALPFGREELRRAGFGEIQRIIREVEPPRPSTKLSTMGEQSGVFARKRQADPRSLRRLLRGDLDWITMKALEKDRARRYATAEALAKDVSRHLDNQPVEAGPPGAMYRLGKFIQRHRARIAASAVLVAVAAVAGIYAVTVEERARLAAAQKTQKAIRRLKADARSLMQAGDHKRAEEAYAKALGLDDRDGEAQAGMAMARREQDIHRISALVQEHLSASRFSLALGMAKATELRYPADPGVRSLVRQAAGTATLSVTFELGRVLRAELQAIEGSAKPPLRIPLESLCKPPGIDIEPGWHRLRIEYIPNGPAAISPAIETYLLRARRSHPYHIHARRLLVGNTKGAHFASVREALRSVTPGAVLAIAPGEHDLRGCAFGGANLRATSLDPNQPASLLVGQYADQARFEGCWDVRLSGLCFSGRSSDESWPGAVHVDRCVAFVMRNCRMQRSSIEASNCYGLTVRDTVFDHAGPKWMHHWATFEDSRHVTLRSCRVSRTRTSGFRTFVFMKCDGLLILSNRIDRSGLVGLDVRDSTHALIAGNTISNHHEGNIRIVNTMDALLAFNELSSSYLYNAWLSESSACVAHNRMNGAKAGIRLSYSFNNLITSNLIRNAGCGIVFAGSSGNLIRRNIFSMDANVVLGEESYWGGGDFQENLLDRDIEPNQLKNTHIELHGDNVVGDFDLGKLDARQGRYAVTGFSGDVPLDGNAHFYGPATALEDGFVRSWHSLADAVEAFETCEAPSAIEPGVGRHLWCRSYLMWRWHVSRQAQPEVSLGTLVGAEEREDPYRGPVELWSIFNTWLLRRARAELAGAGAPSPSAGELRRGILAHWSFDEGKGLVGHDLSGNGHHCALHGASWAEGKIGGSVALDGVDDYVSLPPIPIHQTDLTIAAWVCPDRPRGTIFSDWREPHSFWLALFNDRNDLRLQLRNKDQQDIVLAQNDGAPCGFWHHLAVTWDRKKRVASCYVDGLPVGSTRAGDGDVDILRNEREYHLGWKQDGREGHLERHFRGRLDDVRVYSRALSPLEILALANPETTQGASTRGDADGP
ncbi:MAG: protein kinase [Phycisphaerae bacterium]